MSRFDPALSAALAQLRELAYAFRPEREALLRAAFETADVDPEKARLLFVAAFAPSGRPCYDRVLYRIREMVTGAQDALAVSAQLREELRFDEKTGYECADEDPAEIQAESIEQEPEPEKELSCQLSCDANAEDARADLLSEEQALMQQIKQLEEQESNQRTAGLEFLQAASEHVASAPFTPEEYLQKLFAPQPLYSPCRLPTGEKNDCKYFPLAQQLKHGDKRVGRDAGANGAKKLCIKGIALLQDAPE